MSLCQDSANNSTPLWYSSKTPRFGNYSCMNLWKSRPSYSTQVQVEYLYFRQIWLILLKSSRVWPRYSCFRPFMGHSLIIIRLWPIYTNFYHLNWDKTGLLNLKTRLIFHIRLDIRLCIQLDIRLGGRVTQPRSINFTIRLQLNLGHRLLVSALTMNLKSGPCFADICSQTQIWPLFLYLESIWRLSVYLD